MGITTAFVFYVGTDSGAGTSTEAQPGASPSIWQDTRPRVTDVPAPEVETTAGPSPSETAGAHDKDVKITAKGLNTSYGISSYEYTVKFTNSGDKPVSYLVTVEAYDKDGDYLGEDSVSAKRLGPGKSSTDEGRFFDRSVPNGTVSGIKTLKVTEVTYAVCDGTEESRPSAFLCS
ncbi:FxLYD domain-containing protein [Streptomyces filamentosus]|uniref:FxLYD domain-containing protein n=1 Tax=Streptomyces filamentosus TaxID=67294 RepID=UPI0033F071DD